MEQGFRVPEEHGGEPRDSNGSFFQIKPLGKQGEVAQACGILWEALLHINGDDTSNWIDVKVCEVDFPMQRVEASLYGYIHAGCKILVAWRGDEPIGILVYNEIWKGLLAVRILYVQPSVEGFGVGKGLIDFLKPRKILFQTRKESPPQNLLKKTTSVKLFAECEKFCTWEMDYQDGK